MKAIASKAYSSYWTIIGQQVGGPDGGPRSSQERMDKASESIEELGLEGDSHSWKIRATKVALTRQDLEINE